MTNKISSTHMPKEDCSFISPEVREIWSNIPNHMKVVTLRSRNGNHNERVNKHSKDDHKTAKPLSFPPRKFTKDNLHDILAELISENYLSEKNEVNLPENKPGSESTLLVNYASANTVNSVDIRKRMSSPRKSEATSNKNETAFSNEITINGKT